MTEQTMTREQHLDLLKRAIAANLDARHEHDKRQERANRGKPIDLKAINAWDLMNTPEEQLYLEAVINNPTRKALQKQLNDLGKHLYRLLGSTKAMLSAAEEIANRKPRRWGIRINIIDKNWDGIGAGNDRWVA